MQPIYLLAIVRKTRDKSSKLTRIAKCCFDHEEKHARRKIGEWWRIELHDNPIPSMLDTVFVGIGVDSGVQAADVLADRLVTGLSIASGVKWEREACGPIDADDAVSLRIELEVV